MTKASFHPTIPAVASPPRHESKSEEKRREKSLSPRVPMRKMWGD